MTTKQNILVIDDDPAIGELITATADTLGFQCSATTNPATFLEMLSPDTTLILLDLLMPGMDGIELLRLLGKQQCGAGIVLISGIGKRTIEAAGQLAEILGLSIVGHLEKPICPIALEELLQKLPARKPPPAAKASPRRAIRKEELQRAIERQEFVVYYQPLVNIATGHIQGVEALARWQHPERGLIFPDSFIGCMENFGLIDELGAIVADRGMSDVGRFAQVGGADFMLSLNASVDSLHSLDFPDALVSIAEKHGVRPDNVTIEITETGIIRELSRTLDILTRLRMKQVRLSIDDFGTGYAMMQQFKTIPATELKIDRSFIDEIIREPRTWIMVRKTIELGHDLGMQVVAEGVETQEQLDLLRTCGCDGAQGYLFSRAIPAPQMVTWLSSYRARPMPGSPAPAESQ